MFDSSVLEKMLEDIDNMDNEPQTVVILRPWDEVIIKVDDTFGYTHKTFSTVKVTVIGAIYNEASETLVNLCYVPAYIVPPSALRTFKIDKKMLQRYMADPRFIGCTGCYVDSSTKIFRHIPAPQGETCERCKTFFEGVERIDGTYRCRACRENPYR